VRGGEGGGGGGRDERDEGGGGCAIELGAAKSRRGPDGFRGGGGSGP